MIFYKIVQKVKLLKNRATFRREIIKKKQFKTVLNQTKINKYLRFDTLKNFQKTAIFWPISVFWS